MKIIYNNIIPFKGFSCINICGILFARKNPISEKTIRHESIHTKLMIGLLILPFYILYILEWLFRLILYGDSHTAYRNISFEREAYANDNDINYKRKYYNWIKYLKQ